MLSHLEQVINMNKQSTQLISGEAPYKVLIVDDDESQRSLQKEVLRQPGFISVEAENGEHALEILKTDHFDVVIMDKGLPGINGDETCRRIRKELKLTLLPIIMVTGHHAYQNIISSMQAGANDFIRKPFDVSDLTSRVKSFAENKRLNDKFDNADNMLYSIARMVEARDKNIHNHCERVSYMAEAFGRYLNLNLRERVALRKAGVLHDVGKVSLSDSILLKKQKLNEEEWLCMRQHPLIGESLLTDFKSMQDVLPIVRHHHERWDGSGYPDGLKGEDIPFLARVFQFVDIYDALVSERSYKEAFSMQKIIEIFEAESNSGLLDPELNLFFLDILRNKPEIIEVP